MACRTTSGGRAASAYSTLAIPGSSARIPNVLHLLIRAEEEADPEAADPTVEEVVGAFELMAYRTRNEPGIGAARRARVLHRINEAIAAYRSGDEALPNRATLRAWQHLPSALETERILGRRMDRVPTQHLAPEFRPGVDKVKPYHLAFSRLKSALLPSTDSLFRSRPSLLAMTDAERVFEDWLSHASSAYDLPKPNFRWDSTAEDGGGGVYYPQRQEIVMSKVSITTLLHEFRHHLQHHGAAMIDPDLEEDARAWSLSLYYSVRPNLLKKLVQQGRIFHIAPKDFEE